MRLGGYALLGVGGISMLVGGIFGGLTLGKKNDLNASHMVDNRKAIARDGKTFALVSNVTCHRRGSGSHRSRARARQSQASQPSTQRSRPSLGRGHAGLTWSLRF